MKNLKRLGICSILVFSLFITGCSNNGGGKDEKVNYVEPTYNTEHTDVDFNELTYVRPDTEALDALIVQVKEISQKEDAEEQLLKGYDDILSSVMKYDTMQTLVSILSAKDVKDEFYSNEDEFLTNYYTKLDNKMLDLTKTILDSKYAKAFENKMGKDFIKRYEINSKLNSPEVEELTEQETALVNEYKKASVDPYTTTWKGKEVGVDDLDFSDPDAATPYYEIYEKKNAVTGELYRKLVQVRVKIAKKLGYDSYTEYAYEVLGYDFKPEDSKKLQDYVVKNIAPLYDKVSSAYQSDIANAKENNTADFDSGIPTLEKAIKKEFPEYMMSALDYMKRNNMYLYTDDANANQAAYSTLLNEYSAPFMFVNTSVYTDPSTIFHEFGHYYNFFHYAKLKWNDSNDLNLAEIHSQGLEVLMYPYYEDLYGENAKLMEYDNLSSMLQSILAGCAEDEFQQAVFEDPTMSLDDMNALHGSISTKYYGYPQIYEWVDIHHHFETPFYYISYATSAVSALELWQISSKDRTEALDIYDKITKHPENSHYLDALKNVGLSNPFKSDIMSDIATALKKEMDL
ncbi:peptidase M3 [Amedibacillus sp. YH-ame10]